MIVLLLARLTRLGFLLEPEPRDSGSDLDGAALLDCRVREQGPVGIPSSSMPSVAYGKANFESLSPGTALRRPF